MIIKIPTTLLFAGLFPLLLSPCPVRGAQAPVDSSAASVFQSETSSLQKLSKEDLEDFQWVHSVLVEMAKHLGNLENDEDVALYTSEKWSMWLRNAMERLLKYYVRIQHAPAPEAAQQREILEADVRAIAIAHTQGPESLERFLWGWEHLSALMATGCDIGPFATCFHNYAYSTISRFEIKLKYGDVCDKISADDASMLYVYALVRAMRGEDGSGYHEYAPAPEEFRAWMTGIFGTLEDAEALVREQFSIFKEKDYFGSEKLKKAVLLLDKPYVPLEEQIRRNKEYAENYNVLFNEFMELLHSVKDQAGADAIAPRVAEINAAIEAVNEEYRTWRESIYFNDKSECRDDEDKKNIIYFIQLKEAYNEIREHSTEKLKAALGIEEDDAATPEEEKEECGGWKKTDR